MPRCGRKTRHAVKPELEHSGRIVRVRAHKLALYNDQGKLATLAIAKVEVEVEDCRFYHGYVPGSVTKPV